MGQGAWEWGKVRGNGARCVGMGQGAWEWSKVHGYESLHIYSLLTTHLVSFVFQSFVLSCSPRNAIPSSTDPALATNPVPTTDPTPTFKR